GRALRLCGAVGVKDGHPAAPPEVAPDGEDAPWPLRRTAEGETVTVDDVERRLALAGGTWGDPVRSARVVPIGLAGQSAPAGVLVAGVSPSRGLDEGYASFYELLAGQLSVALGNAQAHEEERRRTEALAELDRAKTAFFSNVSHEFRTPLTLMLAPLEDALGRPGLAPEVRGELDVAHRNALRLQKLVNTLLDFSRIEAGRAQAVYEPVELGVFTAELASTFRSAFERAGVRLVVDSPPLAGPVHVDREMWEKTVLNLLSNAFKHTFAGEVAVSLRPVPGAVELEVRDTGEGIPPDELPHVFERFHRVRGTRSRTHEGSGIGLTLVRELVRLHGGEVRAESVVGEGTVFTVSLPTGTAHLPADRLAAAGGGSVPRGGRLFVDEALRWLPAGGPDPEAAPGAGADTAGGRVLLADDNADMRDYVARLLREAGWEVEAVPDGVAALAAARERAPDLVLSDVMMPGLDGFGLLRELRASPATATLPVVLLSARAGEESRVEGLDAGADDYLVKPFSARELRARVRVHLELSRLRRDAAERDRRLAVSEARSRFLSTMSHELRTPLNAIAGYVELLEMEVRGPVNDAQRADLERIRRSQAHLLGLVDQVLDFSRVQGGDAEYAPADVSLARLLAELEPALAPRLAAAELSWEARAACGVRADPERLRQVLLHLLSNAVKFTPRGGRVSVACEPSGGGMVAVRVADTGIGIPPGRLEEVFEPFSQPDRTLATPVEGAGLGLSVSRALARAMGGDLTVESTPGEGTTFTLLLPAAG
ncbi:MAG TPA: ATP-binding protein, partial [Longimicrobiaceae bacterium]